MLDILRLLDNTQSCNHNNDKRGVNTTTQVVSLAGGNTDSFRFSDDDLSKITKQKIIHLDVLALNNAIIRRLLIDVKKQSGNNEPLISFCPDIKRTEHIIDEKAKMLIFAGLQLSQIIMVTKDEMTMITDEVDLERGAKSLASFGPDIIMIHLGDEGCYFKIDTHCKLCSGFQLDVGNDGFTDKFVGNILNHLKQYNNVEAVPIEEFVEIARNASQ